jgi:hypothetical protein
MIARIVLASVLLISVVAVDSSVVAAANAVGHFRSAVVGPPDCLSPIGLCTQGTLSGGLKGDFFFTATSLVPTADTATTGVVLYTGDIVLTTKDGTLTCKDAGGFQTVGAGAVASVCAVVGGSAGLAGASGTIQFVGTFTVADGGDGDYRASISLP